MQKLVAALPKRPTNSWFDSGLTFIMLNILFFFCVCLVIIDLELLFDLI